MQKANSQQVSTFYDSFVASQKRIGKNIRHYYLFNKLADLGLRKHHSVLEIGCGIGTLTELIGKYLAYGKIVGTDISAESIEIARATLSGKKNAEFFVTDMTDFSYPKKFDFIVLADVMEHIPVEQHERLFQLFSHHAHEGTILFIHIPHPKQIELLEKVAPETMQIIDQSLRSDKLVNDAYKAGFRLHSLQSYCLTNEQPDYQLVIFGSDKPYQKLLPKNQWEIILRKSWLRARAFFRLI